MKTTRITGRRIVRIATDFREALLNGGPSDNMCFAICWPLTGLLSTTGAFEELICYEGWFESKKNQHQHFWIRIGDWILDPTADQLERWGFPKMPAVYFGPKPDFYPIGI